ncbi:MAG: 4-alpha-glucanotransferase [Verrucomicrobiia bacterium]
MKLSPDKKLAGILCPVFSIRTETDLGIGDTEGVRQMIDWCHKHGFGVLQILPINETSDDNSPYNAISSLALEPTTMAISPDHIPDLSAAKFKSISPTDLLTELREGSVNYTQVKKLKRALLWEAFQSFIAKHWSKKSERAGEFRAFLEASATWLPDYTLFRALMDTNNGSPNWERWPHEHQTSAAARDWLAALLSERRTEFESRERFFAYVQWIAFGQWTKLKAYGSRRKVALMGDIPFGVSRCSADVWANREIFDLDWSGGAPPEPTFKPDLFTEKWGQNWGVPLYRWNEHRKTDFAWWRQRVAHTSSIFHLFRIDHVLGFYRIYAFPWPPQRNGEFLNLTEAEAAKKTGGLLPHFFPGPDTTGQQQKRNLRHGDELLRTVKAAAGETAVVAEDLGMVPPYVRPHLLKLGIPGFKIPHWERNPDYTYVDGAKYPRLSICTPATHDHDPLAAMWRRMWRDHEAARAKQDHHRAHVTWLELQRFCKWCGLNDQNVPREFTPEVHEAYCRRVLESNAWMAIFQITDIFAQETRFNVPGSVAASNWSARLEKTVAELDKDAHLFHKTQSFERLVKESSRAL